MALHGIGDLSALFAGFMIFFVLLVVAVYVYLALALVTIAKKLNYPRPWLAWIPFANLSMILQLGGFHWALVFLILLPIIGWIPLGILTIISKWRIYEARNYPGWLSLVNLLGIIPYIGILASIADLVIWGLVAWKDREVFIK